MFLEEGVGWRRRNRNAYSASILQLIAVLLWLVAVMYCIAEKLRPAVCNYISGQAFTQCPTPGVKANHHAIALLGVLSLVLLVVVQRRLKGRYKPHLSFLLTLRVTGAIINHMSVVRQMVDIGAGDVPHSGIHCASPRTYLTPYFVFDLFRYSSSPFLRYLDRCRKNGVIDQPPQYSSTF